MERGFPVSDKSQHEHNQEVGGLAGLGAGVIAGASAGTAVMPILGTFTGALIGGLLGNELGKTIGGVFLDTFSFPEDTGGGEPPASAPGNPAAGSSQSYHTSTGGEYATGADVLVQLERLGQLHKQGLITDEEFRAAKAQLLGL